MRLITVLLLVALPLLEIATFIKVGEWIGVLPTVGLIVLSFVAGVLIIRWQGLSLLARTRDSLRQNAMPVSSAVHGAFLLVAGILLAIPGFLTDIAAFMLLIPPVRVLLMRVAAEKVRKSPHVSVHMGGVRASGDGGPFGRPRYPGRDDPRGERGPIIEGEVIEDLTPGAADDGEQRPPGSGSQPPGLSPWRR